MFCSCRWVVRKNTFYCLVSTSPSYRRVLTAVPKLWFAFQCQSGNNVVETLDVPWSAAWTLLPFIGRLTCLTGQGFSHKATGYFPALQNASQVWRWDTVSALFDFISLWLIWRKKKKMSSVPLVLFAHFRMPPQCQPAQQWNQYFLSHSKGQVLQQWWILDRTLAASETAQKSRRPHLDQAAKVTAEPCVNIGCFQWPLQPNLILQCHFRAKLF